MQHNSSDCGIYLLHLAQTFMSNPVHYRRLILVSLQVYSPILQYPLMCVTQNGGISLSNRMAAWNDHQVINRREDLRTCIRSLSRKQMKKEASSSHTVEVIESDCEIDILEPSPSIGKAKFGRT